MKTNDRKIDELISSIRDGKTQLPDFQRGWVWDDYRIKALIASITNGYPIGAAMFLEYGNENIRFKYRPIEGVNPTNAIPDELVLDGQQRLTSIFAALACDAPVTTTTEADKKKKIKRYYYMDMVKALDPSVDRLDAILSVPEDRKIKENFGRDVILDLSSRELEFENKMFPLNITLNIADYMKWQNDFLEYYSSDQESKKLNTKFGSEIVIQTIGYTIPIITLDKNTPKEAVCQVFENVNTGGVSLTVFELVTAVFAMDDFDLRKDWEERKEKHFYGPILSSLTATDFLTSLTLLSSYRRNKNKAGAVTCKKKDVLDITLQDFQNSSEELTTGFLEVEKILEEERIFSSKDIPYTTQLIPMAVLCTLLKADGMLNSTTVRSKIKQWYWCGVFGEMYGGANETRFVNDVVGVMKWIEDDKSVPKTVQDSYFNPTRLLSLQSRQSAAYKGIMALILQNHCKDIISGREMDFTVFKSESIDIHHIFPKSYCDKQGYSKTKWNSIVNKTPLTYSTNREVGGDAPSKYLNRIERKGKVTPECLDKYLESHLIDVPSCREDDFNTYFLKRAIALLNLIEKATGKTIAGRDSDQVVFEFGASLAE